MSDLEILERGIDYTKSRYETEMISKGRFATVDDELSRLSTEYSGQVIYKVLSDPEGTPCLAFTRTDNLRSDMASISHIAIKNELLKNAVDVALYNMAKNNGRAMMSLDVTTARCDNDMATIIYNNLGQLGVEHTISLLDNPTVLFSLCNSFADYRKSSMRQEMDNFVAFNAIARQTHDELDVYCARSRASSHGVSDTTILQSFGDDGYGGFSGFGRK